MKHIHKFDSEQDYQNKLRLGKEGGFNGPNISLVKENKTVYYGPALFGPLIFEATDENNICSLNLGAVQHLYVDGGTRG